MPLTTTIRIAKNSDFLQIAALDRRSWGTDPVNAFIPDGEHVWRLWVEYGYVFVAEQAGNITGAILAFPTTDTARSLYAVHKVFVDDGLRGHGIGSGLFLALLKLFDEKKIHSFLTVRPENAAAIKVYEKMGYEKERYIEGYYRPVEHRYVMARPPK